MPLGAKPLRYLLLALSLIVAIPLGLAMLGRGPLSAEAAAWGQAAGTIWAITAAYYIAAEGHRRDERRRIHERLSFLSVVHHLAHEAQELANKAEATLETQPRLPAADFEDVREALDRLPVELMGSGRLEILVRQLRRQVRHLADAYALLGSRIALVDGNAAKWKADAAMRAQRIRDQYGQIELHIQGLEQEAGEG